MLSEMMAEVLLHCHTPPRASPPQKKVRAWNALHAPSEMEPTRKLIHRS